MLLQTGVHFVRAHLNGILQRTGELREGLRSGLGHVPAILEADAELAGDVEAGFVRETHAGAQRSGIAVHQISGFVAVEADAVAGPMRQAGQAICRRAGIRFARV